MKLLLINNHSILNVGDYAILQQTLRALGSTWPDADVTLSFNDVASARSTLGEVPIVASPINWFTVIDEHGVYAPTTTITWLRRTVLAFVAALLMRYAGRSLPRRLLGNAAPFLHSMAAADVVLGCGGGYLFSTAAEEVRGFWLRAFGCLLAIVMGKPLLLLPQSIGPLHAPWQRRLVRAVVRHARLTCTREARSLALLRELGCAARAIELPDLAFGLQAANDLATDQAVRRLLQPLGKVNALVGITALDWGRQSRGFGGQADYEHALVGLIDHLTGDGVGVVLFAQCYGPGALEDDRLVNHRLYAAANRPDRIVLVDELLDPATLQAAYARMDCFVGTRMHSIILAANAGVPALAIAYLHKTTGLFDALGLGDRCIPIGGVTAVELIAAFERLREQPDATAADRYVARARRFTRALVPLLRMAAAQR